MKPELIIAPAQDRPATWEEIRRATSCTPDRILELCYTKGNYCEVGSDLGGIIRYPADEFEFFAYLSEMDEASVN
ncbi:MAG TPA: hypothetical protein VNI36_13300 [Candidatus Dormibacteraeota bacterium]|nr:hypothetical protein [Candidatus Dormibacteraeota bacterium]